MSLDDKRVSVSVCHRKSRCTHFHIWSHRYIYRTLPLSAFTLLTFYWMKQLSLKRTGSSCGDAVLWLAAGVKRFVNFVTLDRRETLIGCRAGGWVLMSEILNTIGWIFDVVCKVGGAGVARELWGAALKLNQRNHHFIQGIVSLPVQMNPGGFNLSSFLRSNVSTLSLTSLFPPLDVIELRWRALAC